MNEWWTHWIFRDGDNWFFEDPKENVHGPYDSEAAAKQAVIEYSTSSDAHYASDLPRMPLYQPVPARTVQALYGSDGCVCRFNKGKRLGHLFAHHFEPSPP